MTRLLAAAAIGAAVATVWAEHRPWGLNYYRRAYHQLALGRAAAITYPRFPLKMNKAKRTSA
ncbi:MAG TPA: hypothetical protein VGH54_10395 [Mycobacterium sp.]|jgi:hypothetical protein|uniref:hypothetical protein n=1 Tax=Mycobacterium sp. TaxID=1785 RepID=UPI002F409C15